MKDVMAKNRIIKVFSIACSLVVLTACGQTVDEQKVEETLPSIQEYSQEIVTEEATVCMENTEEKTEPKVYFNWVSGFYENDIELEMFCPVEGAQIYYTTDGNLPTTESNVYSEPIKLTNKTSEKNVLCDRTDFSVDSQYVPTENIHKANVIRAIAYFDDGTSSEITNGTFFVGLDRTELYADVPVISIITEPSNLFDYENGIFILGKGYDEWIMADPKNAQEPGYRSVGNFSQKGKQGERPVSFEYIDKSGKVAVAANMGLRIKGASTRTYLQKSMTLVARDEYGTKNIKYEIIPSNERSDKTGNVDKYKSFVVRNGGNDTDFGKLRDPFIQTVVSERNVETQQFCPCVVFIDGEYWGLYTLVEDYTDNYFENNYGIDKGEIVVVKCGEIDEGNEDDIVLYDELFNFIIDNDMTVTENYEKAKSMLDIEGFIEYCAINLYIYNHDSIFDNNNWSMWRTREANNTTNWSDGKWRMMVYDTEFSTGVYTGGMEFDQNNISDMLKGLEERHEKNIEDKCPAEIFKSLYENENFKHDFIVTLCDIRNYDFEKTSAWKILGEISPIYTKLAPESIRRYGPDWVVLYQDPEEYYKGRIKELQSYIGGRYGAFPQLMKETFMLSRPVNVSVEIPSKEDGTVRVNYTDINPERMTSSTFNGAYFTEYEITLSAKASEGKKFVRWEAEDCEVSDADSETITVKLSKDCKISPVFE